MTDGTRDADDLPVCDVHAHYLSREALPRLRDGLVPVELAEVWGAPESITAKGMPVGASIDQLASVEGILEGMGAEGLERRVLSPPPFTFRYWEEPTAGVALCRMLNDQLAEAIDGHDSLVGLATVPLQDTGAAIEELERATKQLGLLGVEVGTYVGEENLSAPRLEPFFASAAAAGLPVLVHPDFKPNPRWSDHYLINLLGLPVETAIAMSNLVFSGTLDRLPDLRICFLHGGGAAPYLYGRWQMGWNIGRPDTRTAIGRPPSDYLKQIYCDTLTHSPEALAYLIEVMGADRVVLGTDSPFDVRDPDPLAHLDAVAGLTQDQRIQIARRSPNSWLTGAVQS